MSLTRGSSQARDQTTSLALAGGFYTTEPPGKPRTKEYTHCECVTLSQPGPIESDFTIITIHSDVDLTFIRAVIS